MKMEELRKAGTSAWLDDLSRSSLSGDSPKNLSNRVARKEVWGVTTNPAIFTAAITKDPSYQNDIKTIRNLNAEEIIEQLTTDDVRAACKIMKPVFDSTQGVDGRVSIEVDPRLAHETEKTISQAKRLWAMIDQPNLMIKIPATKAGLPAITEVIASGISVNVTLIFSLERYEEVIDAYLAGAKRAAKPELIQSVASFFISRLDSAIDPLLTDSNLKGKAAVANARMAYKLFVDKFKDVDKRINLQRPLWASTGVKNADYLDTKYVTELIAPNTVNTMPPSTLDAFLDHGVIDAQSINSNLELAESELSRIEAAGIDLKKITDELERDGVEKFIAAWESLIELVRVSK